jgi:hypothetical protein
MVSVHAGKSESRLFGKGCNSVDSYAARPIRDHGDPVGPPNDRVEVDFVAEANCSANKLFGETVEALPDSQVGTGQLQGFSLVIRKRKLHRVAIPVPRGGNCLNRSQLDYMFTSRQDAIPAPQNVFHTFVSFEN